MYYGHVNKHVIQVWPILAWLDVINSKETGSKDRARAKANFFLSIPFEVVLFSAKQLSDIYLRPIKISTHRKIKFSPSC